MSINDGSKENLDDCESVISSEGKKKVKYVIRHKPKESQVNNQKFQWKNSTISHIYLSVGEDIQSKSGIQR